MADSKTEFGVTVDANGAAISGIVLRDAVITPREIFLEFLRHMFSSAAVGSYKYSKDRSLTEIIIEDSSFDGFSSANTVPVITVSRGTATFMNTAIADTAGEKFNKQSINLMSGGDEKIDNIHGVLIVNCYSPVGLEAENLAWAVAMLAKIGSPKPLCKSGMFHTISPATISPIVQYSRNEAYKYASVAINYIITITWSVNTALPDYFKCVKLNITNSL